MTTPKITTRIDLTSNEIRALATRRALGATQRELVEEFGYSRVVINRALSSELAKTIQKEITDTAVTSAVAIVKRELAELVPLTMKALRANLEDDNMDAVRTVLKVLGLEQQEKSDGAGMQAMQVILPGATPQVKDVPNDVTIPE